jgi:hypothetical protein
VGGHGSKLGILAVVAGLGQWAFQHYSKIEKTIAPKAASQAQTQVIAAGGAAPQTRDMSIRYVHREGFVLRETESASEKN